MEYKIAKKEFYPWDNAVTQLLHTLEGSPEYLQGAADFKELLSVNRTLPSGHQVGDDVQLGFGTSGCINNCKVIKVHFSDYKVLYDVEVTGDYDAWNDVVDKQDVEQNNKWHTRLYNVDSCFVTKPVTT